MAISLLDPEFYIPSHNYVHNNSYWSRLASIASSDDFYIGQHGYLEVTDRAEELFSVHDPSIDPAIGYIYNKLSNRIYASSNARSVNIDLDGYVPYQGSSKNFDILSDDIDQIQGDIELLSDAKCWPNGFIKDEVSLSTTDVSTPINSLDWQRCSLLANHPDYFNTICSDKERYFPSIIFKDNVLEKSYDLHKKISLEQDDYHKKLFYHLAILNNFGVTIMESDNATRVQLFKKHGIDASGSSPNEKRNASNNRNRTIDFSGDIGEIFCEWHTKINAYLGGRIYFALRDKKILVGAIVKHL